MRPLPCTLPGLAALALALLALLALLAVPDADADAEASAAPERAGISSGFGWDSGPGRHRASPREPDLRSDAARALELRRLRQDESRNVRAAAELRQALRESARRFRDLRPRAALERERRLDDEIDRADRLLDLDAAALRGLPGAGPSAAEIVRARMRRDLERTQHRADRHSLRVRGGFRYGGRTSRGLGPRR